MKAKVYKWTQDSYVSIVVCKQVYLVLIFKYRPHDVGGVGGATALPIFSSP